MEDGVLDQRLQRKAGDQAAVGKVFVLDIADIKGDRAAVAVLLDREIVVEQGKLLIQRHKPLIALGNAFQQAGERRDHLGNAGRMLDGSHPLDAVEGIVDEMRVDLVLQHPVFKVLLLLFVLKAAVHQGGDVARHFIDAAADVAQLVVPLNGRVSGKIAAADRLDPALQRRDRAGDHPVQKKCQRTAQRQNGRQTEYE